MRSLILLAALLAPLAQAQTAASAPASAPASAAKKALVARILKLQQPGVENLARQLAAQPAVELMQRAQMALQRLPAEQREQLARDIQGDVRKYADEATPLVRDRALELAPATIGSLLEDRFSDAELKQIAAMLESPAVRKFQGLLGDMQRSLGERLVAETRASVDPKLRALEQSVRGRLEAAAAASAASAAAGASKP
jgi:uncharacterized protein